MDELGRLLRSQGKYADAVSIYQELLMSLMKVLGKKHPNTINCMHVLARTLEEEEKYAEAELIFRDILARKKATLQEDPST
jgi:hypothetical protein